MPSYVTPKKNTAFECYVSLVSQSNTKIVQVSPTIAAGDVKVSTDNGASANITTLPVVGTNTRLLKVNLSASEMNGDNVSVVFSDAAGNEWCDLVLNIQTSVNQIDDLATPTNITAGTITTVTNLTNAPTNGDLTATMKTSVTTAATAATPTAAAVTGAVGSVTGNVGGNVIGTVGSVVGAVGSVAGLTASDVGAIKAKTDSLAFTVAGQVDANIQYVNDVVVTGDGQPGSEWGP